MGVLYTFKCARCTELFHAVGINSAKIAKKIPAGWAGDFWGGDLVIYMSFKIGDYRPKTVLESLLLFDG